MNPTAIRDYLSARTRARDLSGPSLLFRGAAKSKRITAKLVAEARVLPVRLAAKIARASTVTLYAPAFFGEFEIGLDSHLLRPLLSNSFERALANLVAMSIDESDDIVDVGANIGLFTVLAAKRAPQGRVLAVEPAAVASMVLARNINRNDLRNVEVFNGAVADEPGTATLHIVPGMDEYSSISGIHHPNARSNRIMTETIECETVDRLVDQHGLKPRFMKIDVEGAEHRVLRGAADSLQHFRPVVLSELDDRLLEPAGTNSREIRATFEDLGYDVFDAYNGNLVDSPFFVGEIIALPRER